MGVGTSYNASANYSIQQQLQAGGFGGLQSTLNTGFSAAADMTGVGFGPQIGQFASSFQNMNLNVFGGAMGGMGGMGMGNIGGFGGTPNPMSELAYQSRYSGMQFAPGGMSAFRGGNTNQFALGSQPMQFPGFFTNAGIAGLSGATVGVPSEIASMNSDFNQQVAQNVSSMLATGVDPNTIALQIRQMQTNHMAEVLQLVSTMSQSANNIASSIISKISA